MQGNVLHSKHKDEAQEFSNRFVLRLLDMVRQELRETGDRDWMVDCVDQASVRLSHIEGVSRRVASGLAKLGFGPGQTLHTAYNSCLNFYWPVFGAWLNAGVVNMKYSSLLSEGWHGSSNMVKWAGSNLSVIPSDRKPTPSCTELQ